MTVRRESCTYRLRQGRARRRSPPRTQRAPLPPLQRKGVRTRGKRAHERLPLTNTKRKRHAKRHDAPMAAVCWQGLRSGRQHKRVPRRTGGACASVCLTGAHRKPREERERKARERWRGGCTGRTEGESRSTIWTWNLLWIFVNITTGIL